MCLHPEQLGGKHLLTVMASPYLGDGRDLVEHSGTTRCTGAALQCLLLRGSREKLKIPLGLRGRIFSVSFPQGGGAGGG